MSAKVVVSTKVLQGVNGYDVCVADPTASVQDYLDAVNTAIENGRLFRGRAERQDCMGCDLCCAERVPLTSIDVLQLRRHLVPKDSVTEFIRKAGYVYVDGAAVDITLGFDRRGRCRFLDKERKLCRVYAHRPLVCQTFICCPQTRRARRLRECIVNRGEDELVRLWLLENGDRNVRWLIDEAVRTPAISLDDWPMGPFSGKTAFADIMLKDVCPPKLWCEVAVR